MASKAAAFTGITAWLYYHSLWAMIALTPIFIWEYRKSKEECERKKRQKFLLQFKEMIQSMAAALGTGYSVENAMKETQKNHIFTKRNNFQRNGTHDRTDSSAGSGGADIGGICLSGR